MAVKVQKEIRAVFRRPLFLETPPRLKLDNNAFDLDDFVSRYNAADFENATRSSFSSVASSAACTTSTNATGAARNDRSLGDAKLNANKNSSSTLNVRSSSHGMFKPC